MTPYPYPYPYRWVTYTDPDRAEDAAARWNRGRQNMASALRVVVDGPEDGEATVMPLRDAVENGFLYRWSAG